MNILVSSLMYLSLFLGLVITIYVFQLLKTVMTQVVLPPRCGGIRKTSLSTKSPDPTLPKCPNCGWINGKVSEEDSKCTFNVNDGIIF